MLRGRWRPEQLSRCRCIELYIRLLLRIPTGKSGWGVEASGKRFPNESDNKRPASVLPRQSSKPNLSALAIRRSPFAPKPLRSGEKWFSAFFSLACLYFRPAQRQLLAGVCAGAFGSGSFLFRFVSRLGRLALGVAVIRCPPCCGVALWLRLRPQRQAPGRLESNSE